MDLVSVGVTLLECHNNFNYPLVVGEKELRNKVEQSLYSMH